MRYRARVPTSTKKNGSNQAKSEDKQPITVLFDRVMVQILRRTGNAGPGLAS